MSNLASLVILLRLVLSLLGNPLTANTATTKSFVSEAISLAEQALAATTTTTTTALTTTTTPTQAISAPTSSTASVVISSGGGSEGGGGSGGGITTQTTVTVTLPVILTPTSTPTSTPITPTTTANNVPVPLTGAYLGDKGSTGDADVSALEELVGKQFAIYHDSFNDGYNFPASLMLASLSNYHNATPMYDLQDSYRTLAEINSDTINANDKRPNYTVSPDAFFKSWADGLKAYGKPIFLRLDHEMNGNWDPYCFQTGQADCMDQDTGAQETAQEYVAAWQHVHNIFAAEGATNVSFVWCPNDIDVSGNAPAMSSYYPGDTYVDWTCFDAYNWSPPATWTAFSPLVTSTYNAILQVAPTKPMMIGEFNSGLGTDPTGDQKGQWFIDAYHQIATNFPAIKAVVLFDVNMFPYGQNIDWRVENNTSTLQDFAQSIASPYFLSTIATTTSSQ
jgi:beta-mannanase